MDKAELQFRSDASVDASSVIIEDYAGDRMVRVYPYFLPNTKKGNEFLQTNSTTLVFYTQEVLGKEELLEDEDGNYYFEILPSMTTATQEITNAGINKISQELSEVKGFSAISNYWPKNLQRNLQLGQFNLIPMVFSIGAPLDKAAWLRNEQPVFIASNITSAKDSESDLAYEIVEDGLVEMSFVNVFNLTTQYRNASIYFTDYDLTKINSLSIGLPTNSLFGGAYGRSIINGRLEDISLAEPKKYPIWNAVPISVDNRVEMFMKWADTKMVLPIHVINKFSTEQPLSKLFKGDTDAWLVDGEALYTLLKDMILYTQMYVNGWNDIQADDKLSDPTNSNYGTIKVNVTLGSESAPATYTAGKKVVNLVVGKNPAEIVETLYEAYLRENPNVDKNTLSIFKAAVVALSRYIRSGNLALGGGLNDFNSIYLPWRLKMANKINITRTAGSNGEANYSLKEDPQVAFDSHWYAFDGGVLKAIEIDNLYETQLIQSERNITQPLIPMELEEEGVSSNPGGVNIDSDSELKYNWIIPTTDQNVLDKLMLKDLNVTITDAKDQVLNDRTIRITNKDTLTVINELDAILAGKTLAATWDAETDEVKRLIRNWYSSHNFFVSILLMGSIEKTKRDIITATGFNPEELESFGVTGADWLVTPTDPYKIVWDFMKVIKTGFDRTTFETVPHIDQWNGSQFSTDDGNIIEFPAENWLREIKGSWLNKYITDEAALTLFLRQSAARVLSKMTPPDWSTATVSVTQADVEKYFPGLKGHMTFSKFDLTINGSLVRQVHISTTDPHRDHNVWNIGGGLWAYTDASHTTLTNAQAIIKLEIIEQIPIIYPNAIHYKLKSGVVQSFNLGTDRKLIFTKDEWQNMMRTIKPTTFYETIDMSPIKGETFGEIREIDVFALWTSSITLSMDGINIEIDSINDNDEKIVKQKIIFT